MDIYTALFARHVKKLTIKGDHNEVHGLCPFHEEVTPSWSGNRTTGLSFCHACGAKCNADQFAERLGDTEWKPEKEPKNDDPWTQSTVIATYDYCDANGTLCYQVVRFKPKDFRIRRPDGRGGWIKNGSGITRVLFQLPALKDAREVFLTEGEADVLALQEHQLVATTIAQGAHGTVTEDMLRPLANKQVVILPDNDRDGREYGQKMLTMLSPIADSVRLLELPGLPPKEDVRWWLANGHTIEELQELVRKAPILGGLHMWEPVMKSFNEYIERKVPFLWYPYLPIGRITILEGDPGQGKSWFSLAVASCASIGHWLPLLPECENFTEPTGVVYITSEDDPEDTIKSRLRILQADLSKIHNVEGKAKGTEGAMAITLSDLPMIARAIDRAHAKLVIIDPIQAYLPTGADMNKAEQVRPLMAKLQALAKEKECAVLMLRHLSKGSKENSLYRGMGSIDWTAAARSVLFCGERKEMRSVGPMGIRKRVGIVQIKNNIAPLGPSVEFELGHDEFLWVGKSEISAEQLIASSAINLETLREVKDFLMAIIGEEGKTFNDIVRQGRGLGFTIEQLKVARESLGLSVAQVYGQWRWMLPKNQQNGP